MFNVRRVVVIVFLLLILTACKRADHSNSSLARVDNSKREAITSNLIKEKVAEETEEEEIEEIVEKEAEEREEVKEEEESKVDDWCFDEELRKIDDIASSSGGSLGVLRTGIQSLNAPIRVRGGSVNSIQKATLGTPRTADAIGFSVGGAKDVDNFRENIKNGFMPIPTDLTYEGLFYDYYFDTGIEEKAVNLFEPSYTSIEKKNPLSGEKELYLSVGLNSNLTEASFKRKKLNLVIVLDISGSMSSSFNQYHYDKTSSTEKSDYRTKMEIANESIVALTKHLNPDDRFAVVLYDDYGVVAKPLNLVGKTDMKAIRKHILDINPRGGTNMYAGMTMGTSLYDSLKDVDPTQYENRMIFLTDAMPNRSVTSEKTIWGILKANAANNIYTSYIGIGVDFNTELVEYITKTKGANYYAVHNSEDFKRRMDDEFDFMVTPLVFDLILKLESDSYEIEEVFGSPEADISTGQIMKVSTLFPSKTEGGETKGGIILLKLKKIKQDGNLKLTCYYKDRDSTPFHNEKEIKSFDSVNIKNSGIRKAVVLTQYVSMLQEWIGSQYGEPNDSNKQDDWTLAKPHNRRVPRRRGRWERQSKKLSVSNDSKLKFVIFKEYIRSEIAQVEDLSLEQEVDLLDVLIKKGSKE